jgi:hypothetical protein
MDLVREIARAHVALAMPLDSPRDTPAAASALTVLELPQAPRTGRPARARSRKLTIFDDVILHALEAAYGLLELLRARASLLHRRARTPPGTPPTL